MSSEEIQQFLKPIQLPLDERVIITCIDSWDVTAEECPRHVLASAAVGKIGNWVLDIVRGTHRPGGFEPNGKPVKWWIVEGHCRTAGLNHVPIYYDGAAMDAPAELLDRAKYTAMRKTSEGPWHVIMSPEIRAEMEAMKANPEVPDGE